MRHAGAGGGVAVTRGSEPASRTRASAGQRSIDGQPGAGSQHSVGSQHSAGSQHGGDEQQLLFGEDAGAGGRVMPEDIGFRGPVACTAAGISYRQLDYWARTGLVEPSVRSARGSGSQRLYGFRDILVLKVVKRLLDTGISLQQIRSAVEFLGERGSADIAQVTLMSDGVSVYACTSPDEVVDLLQGGQGVFGIALGRVWQEVEGSLAELPSESPDQADDNVASGAASDELANRRARRTG
jgi:DNA-binding transcriptional MerR regulator